MAAHAPVARGPPAPLAPLGRGPRPCPRSPAPYGRAPPNVGASGRAVAGYARPFFFGYANVVSRGSCLLSQAQRRGHRGWTFLAVALLLRRVATAKKVRPRCPRRLRRASPAAPAFPDIATHCFLHRGRGSFRLRRRRCGCPPLVEQSDNFPLGHNVKTEHNKILPQAKKEKVKAATPLLLSVSVPTITIRQK